MFDFDKVSMCILWIVFMLLIRYWIGSVEVLSDLKLTLLIKRNDEKTHQQTKQPRNQYTVKHSEHA